MPAMPAQLVRINEIYETDLPAHTAQRIGALARVASALSRRGQVAAKVELANAALLNLCDLLYEPDDDGKPANIDVTSRILVPLPWGRVGAKLWGLRTTEARCLRYIMLARSASDDAWLRYEDSSRNWIVAKPTPSPISTSPPSPPTNGGKPGRLPGQPGQKIWPWGDCAMLRACYRHVRNVAVVCVWRV